MGIQKNKKIKKIAILSNFSYKYTLEFYFVFFISILFRFLYRKHEEKSGCIGIFLQLRHISPQSKLHASNFGKFSGGRHPNVFGFSHELFCCLEGVFFGFLSLGQASSFKKSTNVWITTMWFFPNINFEKNH